MNWSKDEIIVLKKKYGNIQNKEIAKILKRTINSIALKAAALGLKGNPSKTRRKYTLNEDYFQIPNIENSYWAGFLAADGCIDSKRKFRIRLKLTEKDSAHLDIFKSQCNYSGKIYTFKQRGKKYCSLEINSKKWIKDLNSNFKITPIKTFTIKAPELSYQNSLAFIIGYIDGDGCISYETPSRGKPRLRLSLIGTKEMLRWIKTQFDFISSKHIKSKIRKNKSMWVYCIAGSKAAAVLKQLQNVTKYKLERKWNKICMI